MPVANQICERRERRGALAGAKRCDAECGIGLVEPRGSSLLITAQDACGEGRVHDASPFNVALLFEYLAHTFSSLCRGKPSAQLGGVSISRRRIAFASSARAASTSATISSCVVIRIGGASAGLVSIRVTVARRMSAAV